MKHILYISPQKLTSYKLSILVLMLIALMALLVYSLVNIYFKHQHIFYANKSLLLPKIQQIKTIPNKLVEKYGWITIKALPRDSLATIFKRVGLNQQTLQAVLYKNQLAKILAKIKPNQEIKFLIKDNILKEIIFTVSSTQFLTVSHQNKFYKSSIKMRKMERRNEYITATVKGSLYNTAKKMKIPLKLIKQMTAIFNWEMNFPKDIRPGDQISMVYQAYYINEKLVTIGDILAVSYTNRGTKHQAVRHINSAGDYDYFSPKGTSLKKAFSRYPIKFSHISSSYNLSRYHPILHYRRAHKGVDLAASIGTPIHATGNGHIHMIGRHNAYGNMIQITHDKTYTSLYAHLLKFQKGLSKGDSVKRGQIIGYVGQTGLADGPHCHYEFHVNNQPKNPTTVSLPRSWSITQREIRSFKAKSRMLIGQLKLYEMANLASNTKKNHRRV